MNNVIEIQKKIRENAEELSSYVKDLKEWTTKIEKEDKQLKQKAKNPLSRVCMGKFVMMVEYIVQDD